MKFLVLSGHGVKINVDSGRLHVQDGRTCVDKEPEKFVFRPKMCNYDNIVIYGHNGYITFEAMRWLVKQNIQLTILDWDGKLLTSMMPVEAKQTKIKFAQYRAYESEKRIQLAKNIINAKIQNSKSVLTWLKQKYPEISDETKFDLRKTRTIKNIMDVEAWVADIYWKQVRTIVPKKFDYISRQSAKQPRHSGAIDPINALFNYGYALLESHCRRAINMIGLDVNVGFMHEVVAGKTPLVYDLQEPFRCLVDVAVINALEKKLFDKEDFILTENYNIRLKPSGAKKLVKEVETVFNSRIMYRGESYTWSSIILFKAQELAHYLIGKRPTINFSEPSLTLKRTDDFELRHKILGLTQSEAGNIGIGKSSLHYLRKHARSDEPFKVYEKVKEKLR